MGRSPHVRTSTFSQFYSDVEKLQRKKKTAQACVCVKHNGTGGKKAVSLTYLNDLNKWTSAGLDKVVLHCVRTLTKLENC